MNESDLTNELNSGINTSDTTTPIFIQSDQLSSIGASNNNEADHLMLLAAAAVSSSPSDESCKSSLNNSDNQYISNFESQHFSIHDPPVIRLSPTSPNNVFRTSFTTDNLQGYTNPRRSTAINSNVDWINPELYVKTDTSPSEKSLTQNIHNPETNKSETIRRSKLEYTNKSFTRKDILKRRKSYKRKHSNIKAEIDRINEPQSIYFPNGESNLGNNSISENYNGNESENYLFYRNPTSTCSRPTCEKKRKTTTSINTTNTNRQSSPASSSNYLNVSDLSSFTDNSNSNDSKLSKSNESPNNFFSLITNSPDLSFEESQEINHINNITESTSTSNVVSPTTTTPTLSIPSRFGSASPQLRTQVSTFLRNILPRIHRAAAVQHPLSQTSATTYRFPEASHHHNPIQYPYYNTIQPNYNYSQTYNHSNIDDYPSMMSSPHFESEHTTPSHPHPQQPAPPPPSPQQQQQPHQYHQTHYYHNTSPNYNSRHLPFSRRYLYQHRLRFFREHNSVNPDNELTSDTASQTFGSSINPRQHSHTTSGNTSFLSSFRRRNMSPMFGVNSLESYNVSDSFLRTSETRDQSLNSSLNDFLRVFGLEEIRQRQLLEENNIETSPDSQNRDGVRPFIVTERNYFNLNGSGMESVIHLALHLESSWRGIKSDELLQLPTHYYSDKQNKKRNKHLDENNDTDNEPDDSLLDKCIICLEEFIDEDFLRTLHCSHQYHVECIDKWLKMNRTCPMCRSDAVGKTVLFSPLYN